MKLMTFFKLLYIKYHKTDNNIVFFSSFDGHYSDSPKYISEKLHEISPNVKIVWLIESHRTSELPSYVIPAIKNTFAETFYYAKAGVVVDNVLCRKAAMLYNNTFLSLVMYRLYKWILRKDNQRCYTTWHGTPLKKMLVDQVGSRLKDITTHNIEMIHGNKYTLEIMNHLMFEKMPMTLMGSPRNDVLLNADFSKISQFKKELKFPEGKKILLYAPSFRSEGYKSDAERSGLNQLKEINITQLCSVLHEKFGGEWCFVCRFHYHVEKLVDWNQLKSQYGDAIMNGNESDDMAEYLACTDILLTDVSSCMYDFALTKKPCLVFFPDLNFYSSSERGLYEKIEDLPFPYTTSFTGLLDNISSFDEPKYVKKVENMIARFGYVDDGASSERIVRYIFSK